MTNETACVDEYGYVYAVGYDGCIKIGISATNPQRRLNNMQSGNAEKIELIGQVYVVGYKEIEKRLHKEWKNKGRWMRGEWYKLSVGEATSIISGLGGEINEILSSTTDPCELREREWMSRIGYPGGKFEIHEPLIPCFFNISPRALHHSDHREKCFALNNVSIPEDGLFDHERNMLDSTDNVVGWITQPYDSGIERYTPWVTCLEEAADKFGLMTICPLNQDAPHFIGTRPFAVVRDPAARENSKRADLKPPFLAWWYQQWNRPVKDSISRDATSYGCHYDHLSVTPDGYNVWEMFECIASIEHYGDRRLMSRAYREFVRFIGTENISFKKTTKRGWEE